MNAPIVYLSSVDREWAKLRWPQKLYSTVFFLTCVAVMLFALHSMNKVSSDLCDDILEDHSQGNMSLLQQKIATLNIYTNGSGESPLLHCCWWTTQPLRLQLISETKDHLHVCASPHPIFNFILSECSNGRLNAPPLFVIMQKDLSTLCPHELAMLRQWSMNSTHFPLILEVRTL